MELYVERFELTRQATVGNLLVGTRESKPRCFTIEDAVREIAGQPVEKWKIPGKTAIPVGRYQVIVNFSQRFKRDMPLILGVPGFDGIRFHIANTALDVEGCIGLGNVHDRMDFVGHSADAFTPFFDDLRSWLRSESVFVTVSNPQ